MWLEKLIFKRQWTAGFLPSIYQGAHFGPILEPHPQVLFCPWPLEVSTRVGLGGSSDMGCPGLRMLGFLLATTRGVPSQRDRPAWKYKRIQFPKQGSANPLNRCFTCHPLQKKREPVLTQGTSQTNGKQVPLNNWGNVPTPNTWWICHPCNQGSTYSLRQLTSFQ